MPQACGPLKGGLWTPPAWQPACARYLTCSVMPLNMVLSMAYSLIDSADPRVMQACREDLAAALGVYDELLEAGSFGWLA